jgi:hypothetical protein
MTMGFRRSDLQEAFFVPGTYPFRVWGYGTTDSLAEVLARDYFRAAGGLMHAGDLIYVSVRPPDRRGVSARRRNQASGADPGEVHMSLVMVRTGERGTPSVRLVQDFGRPDVPDAALTTASAAVPALPAPAKRGRGRPPGSRSRKNGAMPTTAIN